MANQQQPHEPAKRDQDKDNQKQQVQQPPTQQPEAQPDDIGNKQNEESDVERPAQKTPGRPS